MREGVRFQTATRWPAANKALATALPIAPVPITVTVVDAMAPPWDVKRA